MTKFYLICVPDTQLKPMQKAFELANLNSQFLPIMTIEPDLEKLAWLSQNIANYDYILINSPNTIAICKSVLTYAPKAVFLTVGQNSAKLLREQIGNKILFPEGMVGAQALWDLVVSKLNLTDKKILILKGNGGNNYLQEQLELNNINYQELLIYKRVIQDVDHNLLKKNLENGLLQGIIITSSLLVKSLFNQTKLGSDLDLLKRCRFITIDQKIADLLNVFGVNKVYVTPSANRAEIVNLIRNLND